MGSYFYGKLEVCDWIREHFDTDARILDVGACDGKWHDLLCEYWNMDAVEIYKPNAARIAPMYKNTYNCDIFDLEYDFYDLIIFGDVIEHMTVERAQQVLAYADERCTDLIIGVPFLYKQDAIYGNPWEKHIQDDLTRELFAKRYPEYEVLFDAAADYCYYHKKVNK